MNYETTRNQVRVLAGAGLPIPYEWVAGVLGLDSFIFREIAIKAGIRLSGPLCSLSPDDVKRVLRLGVGDGVWSTEESTLWADLMGEPSHVGLLIPLPVATGPDG